MTQLERLRRFAGAAFVCIAAASLAPLDGQGVVVTDGLVLVSSGYPRNGGMPGNVLLAFSAD